MQIGLSIAVVKHWLEQIVQTKIYMENYDFLEFMVRREKLIY